MVFELDDAKLRRVEELFIQPEWLQTPHTVGYDAKMSANPFVAFEQIPPRSRYPVPIGQRALYHHDFPSMVRSVKVRLPSM